MPDTPADYPAPQTYEITWHNGHIETIRACQISQSGSFGLQRTDFHAWVDGRWSLQLSAREEDIRTIRNTTTDERITPEAAS